MNNAPKNDMVVYTALFGDYDNITDPPSTLKNCDFICFTDQKNITSSIWDIRFIDRCEFPPNLMNRKFKILAHRFLGEYDKSIYLDANILIKKDIQPLASRLLGCYDFIAPKHNKRNCLYKEASFCVNGGKSDKASTLLQIKKYENNGFPANYGLSENNIIFRNHLKSQVIKAMEDWWSEILNHTHRDQLSLSYVLWKNEVNFYHMKHGSRRVNSKFFIATSHRGDDLMSKIKLRIKNLINRAF